MKYYPKSWFIETEGVQLSDNDCDVMFELAQECKANTASDFQPESFQQISCTTAHNMVFELIVKLLISLFIRPADWVALIFSTSHLSK